MVFNSDIFSLEVSLVTSTVSLSHSKIFPFLVSLQLWYFLISEYRKYLCIYVSEYIPQINKIPAIGRSVFQI